MSESGTQNHDLRQSLLAVMSVLLLLVGGIGYYLWARYNPFPDLAPAHREARELVEACRYRPLSEEEFSRCLTLCESGDAAVQLMAMAAAEAAVGRTPEYKPRAVEVLERVSAEGNTRVAGAAGKVARRLSPTSAK